MGYKLILFDLDGTLLPMDQDVFVAEYFKSLAKNLAPYGYEPEDLIASVWKGIGAMVKNDGQISNEEAFWNAFTAIYGEQARSHEPIFAEFYATKFNDIKSCCGYTEKAAETIKKLKNAGYRIALATNPIFPYIAIKQRLNWAGLDPKDFELCTTYEISHYCKPNPAYYSEILDKLGCSPEDCLMVGNDARDDTPAESIGISVFMLTDCLINKQGKDISVYSQGGFNELQKFLGV